MLYIKGRADGTRHHPGVLVASTDPCTGTVARLPLPKVSGVRVLIFVAIGGAIGSVGRYLISTPINTRAAPWGTIAVNVLGSAVLGFLIGWLVDRSLDPAIQIGLLTGVLGGFTTFSTFTAETVLLIDTGRWQTALVNIFASVALGVAAAGIGFVLGRA